MAVKRIGILGGTFNPVHNGHLALAEAALKRCGLKKVVFIPTSLPPHKPGDHLASAPDRLEMLRRAVEGHPEYEISDIELKRGGTSYTVTTIRQMQASLEPGTEIHVIVGADNLLEIADWKEIETLARLCHLIVITRPGFSLDKLRGENLAWARKLIKADRSNIIPLSLPISSTDIRERARKGKDLRRLVPEKVAAYIEREGLYRGPTVGGRFDRID